MSELTQFVRVGEAAERTGLSERSIARRIGAGEISAFRDPRDRRHRLVAVSDLGRLTNVVPFAQDSNAASEQRIG